MKRFTEGLFEASLRAPSETRPARAATARGKRQQFFGRIWVGFAVCFLGLICLSPSWAAEEWPRPQLVPLPLQVAGVSQAVLSLNGTWKFTLSPPNEFWSNRADPASWPEVRVPAQLPHFPVPDPVFSIT